MADQATVTLVTGPAVTMTAGVFTDVRVISFELYQEVLRLQVGAVQKEFALSGSNTITMTASGGNYTISIT
jgi:hypothetical protein